MMFFCSPTHLQHFLETLWMPMESVMMWSDMAMTSYILLYCYIYIHMNLNVTWYMMSWLSFSPIFNKEPPPKNELHVFHLKFWRPQSPKFWHFRKLNMIETLGVLGSIFFRLREGHMFFLKFVCYLGNLCKELLFCKSLFSNHISTCKSIQPTPHTFFSCYFLPPPKKIRQDLAQNVLIYLFRILPNFCLADSLTNLITRGNPGLWLDKGCPFEGCAPYDLVITGCLGFVFWWLGMVGYMVMVDWEKGLWLVFIWWGNCRFDNYLWWLLFFSGLIICWSWFQFCASSKNHSIIPFPNLIPTSPCKNRGNKHRSFCFQPQGCFLKQTPSTLHLAEVTICCTWVWEVYSGSWQHCCWN